MAQGTIYDPMTLTEALSSDRIQSGHTVYLKAGTYALADAYTSTLAGGTGELITIRPHTTEPIINLNEHRLDLFGGGMSYVAMRDLVLCDLSTETRETELEGVPAPDLSRGWLDLPADGVTLHNLRIHDTSGVGWWNAAGGGTLDSSDIYNIGWHVSGQPGGGHCLYTQNDAASQTKTIRNCIFGGSYGFVLAPKGSAAAEVCNYVFENCIFLGGDQRFGQDGANVDNIIIRNCVSWASRFHFSGPGGTSVTIEDNYFGTTPRHQWDLTESTVQRNVLVCPEVDPILIIDGPRGNNDWDNNTYITNGFRINGTFLTEQTDPRTDGDFDDWKTATGYDANSTHAITLPIANVQYVFPCIAPRVAHIAVFNWEELETVDVDVSALEMTTDGNYRLRNAYDPLTDYDDFAYDGSGTVTVSFVGRGNAVPLGAVEPILTLDARFGAWILEKLD